MIREDSNRQNRYIGVNVCDLKESLLKTIYLPYAVTSNNHKFISPETKMLVLVTVQPKLGIYRNTSL